MPSALGERQTRPAPGLAFDAIDALAMSPAPRAAIVGLSAVSAHGLDWRGLAQALASGTLRPAPSRQLASSHPATLASEVAAIPPAREVGDAKTRRLMSRAAHLAALAMRDALDDAGWTTGREEIGCFLGVGSSGGPMEELAAILRASVRGQGPEATIDWPRFCKEGLAAAHPLLAFHLLGNFVLCHGSILAGLGGPNRAFYSRGAGTVTALVEACWALKEGECSRTLWGGADSALHLATFVELSLEGRLARGWTPGEGAAVLALAADAERPLAWLEGASVQPGDLAALTDGADLAILAPWGPPAREALRDLVPAQAQVLDLSTSLADPLAAGPALACAAAVDALGSARRAVVLVRGVDEVTAAVRLARGEQR